MEMLILFLLLLTVILLCLILFRLPHKGSENALKDVEQLKSSILVSSTKTEELGRSVAFMNENTSRRIENLRDAVDRNLSDGRNETQRSMLEMRQTLEKSLDEIRLTVDEKLQQTLESRLATSFKTVSGQLEAVYRQLGEMQNLSKEVGNLQKVLTNVKTRGVWGELQAQRILDDILGPDQYVANAHVGADKGSVVEFAVKLPGSEDGKPVYLPVDSKFPREDYERILDSDGTNLKELRSALEARILSEAKDISTKYINVPVTTDFAVLFLPVEGLYAEVLAIAGLQEKVQRLYHVLLTGPSTFASLLNSLQMGFRTLAIEKKSAEVWRVLGQVKTEFSKFADVMTRVQKSLETASKEVENVFTRQRVLNRKLKDVEMVELDSSPLCEDSEI